MNQEQDRLKEKQDNLKYDGRAQWGPISGTGQSYENAVEQSRRMRPLEVPTQNKTEDTKSSVKLDTSIQDLAKLIRESLDKIKVEKESEPETKSFSYETNEIFNKEIIIKISVRDLKTGEKSKKKSRISIVTSEKDITLNHDAGFHYPSNSAERTQALFYSKLTEESESLTAKMGGGQ